jgi:hypothetical protein
MAPGVDQIVGLMGGISIVDHIEPIQTVQQDLEKLIRSAEETVEEARQAQYGIASNDRSVTQIVAALSSLQDIWLMQIISDGNQELESLHNLRKSDYGNGEYLSQGTLYHKYRSCVVSLQSLSEAGLFELYNEFSEPDGKQRWTNRVQELRTKWQAEQPTVSQEAHSALKIARRCFPRFEASDMALVLLAFKNRVTSKIASIQGNVRSAPCLLQLLTNESSPSVELKQVRHVRSRGRSTVPSMD